ncbi:LLM class flavin-dependent oxidoreductase [Priestia aryabhattai]|uniref:LLM class flavin-dependent oxidoreductase n=1 Tax=Priestia TaxID=2800373 RepID=UPI0003AA8A49|nr:MULTISPECIES: LLM class flavin-dependent oxidoreductase [Priestia]MBX9966383.1 LLM class flavin-dependent oxidoreductase [Priestia aryabhattai]MBY0078370.1 LLM class flavin-dependent oxidoreductase [Priestia aryabhattai]MBZ6488108.1 LLM class flavin-dependent oxidoreductase [Priestia aryabhattai]MDH3114968.1 LLM class flavin-dependent oxidoreductase [Priestia aryabhattai]MDH3126137.1 LLM class flavin-dependent oxidoreductase [Priestia aryabhattai]
MKLSILDQSPRYEGERAEDAFQHTIQLAQLAEELGYHRFWVAEHHDSEHVVGSSPEVLISHLLAKTHHIRIGSGGVMLQHYSPYKVAENFNVLASLSPNRIDLGIGRAPGGLPHSTQALQQNSQPTKSLTDKLIELKQYLNDTLPEDHPLYGLKAYPRPQKAADMFLLGASASSAELAASLNLPYVFAQFINGDQKVLEEAISVYNQHVSSHARSLVVALSVIVADTVEEAKALASSTKIFKVYLQNGKSATLGSKEKAEEFGQQSKESYRIEEKEANVIYGTKETVRQKLQALKQAFSIDEFIILTALQDFEQKKRSYTLLKEAFSEGDAQKTNQTLAAY